MRNAVALIASIAILFSVTIGVAYAVPVISTSGSDSSITVIWTDSDTNVLFYLVQVIQTNGEFEKLHKSITTKDKTVTFDADNNDTYEIQVTSVKSDGTQSDDKELGVTTTYTPPIINKPTGSISVSGMTYSPSSFLASATFSSISSGNGHAITDREWSVIDKNGKPFRFSDPRDYRQTGFDLYPEGGSGNKHRVDNYYTISFRVFNGVWSEPATITIDWEPQKRDVINQVKEKIEYAKENNKTHSQKVWQRVLLSLDKNIPADSEYHRDPTKSFGASSVDDSLTPFKFITYKPDSPNTNTGNHFFCVPVDSAKKIADKQKKAADKALKDGEQHKYEKRKALYELWYNIWAYDGVKSSGAVSISSDKITEIKNEPDRTEKTKIAKEYCKTL